VTRARELRFVVVVVDYDVATHLFRDDDSMPQGVIPCLERHRDTTTGGFPARLQEPLVSEPNGRTRMA